VARDVYGAQEGLVQRVDERQSILIEGSTRLSGERPLRGLAAAVSLAGAQRQPSPPLSRDDAALKGGGRGGSDGCSSVPPQGFSPLQRGEPHAPGQTAMGAVWPPHLSCHLGRTMSALVIEAPVCHHSRDRGCHCIRTRAASSRRMPLWWSTTAWERRRTTSGAASPVDSARSRN
jgi:hypothetical protein